MSFKKNIKHIGRCKKFIIKTGSLAIVVVLIGTSIFMYNKHKHEEKAINLVKVQTSNINPNTNFDKAYKQYIQHLAYTYYTDSQGNEFVQVSGKLNLKGREKISDLKLTYIVDVENNNLKFYDMKIDGIKCSEIEALMLKVKVFGSYGGKTV